MTSRRTRSKVDTVLYAGPLLRRGFLLLRMRDAAMLLFAPIVHPRRRPLSLRLSKHFHTLLLSANFRTLLPSLILSRFDARSDQLTSSVRQLPLLSPPPPLLLLVVVAAP